MPWLAIPFENTDSRSQLTSLYGIQGIPSLILLNPDGSVITEDGRGEINDDPLGTVIKVTFLLARKQILTPSTYYDLNTFHFSGFSLVSEAS